MRMVRITLNDGTTKEMTMDEMSSISQEELFKVLDGKAIINTEFYTEDGI